MRGGGHEHYGPASVTTCCRHQPLHQGTRSAVRALNAARITYTQGMFVQFDYCCAAVATTWNTCAILDDALGRTSRIQTCVAHANQLTKPLCPISITELLREPSLRLITETISELCFDRIDVTGFVLMGTVEKQSAPRQASHYGCKLFANPVSLPHGSGSVPGTRHCSTLPLTPFVALPTGFVLIGTVEKRLAPRQAFFHGCKP